MFRVRMKKTCWLLVTTAVIGAAATATAAQPPLLRFEIVADEMCCNGCAQKVAAQLYAAPGVRSVEANVPNRTVTVTAKPTPKLTLERLWAAVEQGEGSPSKLTASQSTYQLTPASRLKPEQRAANGRYAVTISTLKSKADAQGIAAKFYAVQGVEKVSVDVARRTMFVSAAEKTPVSPWRLAAAVEAAKHEPAAVLGPQGLLTITRPAKSQTQRAVRATAPAQGETR